MTSSPSMGVNIDDVWGSPGRPAAALGAPPVPAARQKAQVRMELPAPTQEFYDNNSTPLYMHPASTPSASVQQQQQQGQTVDVDELLKAFEQLKSKYLQQYQVLNEQQKDLLALRNAARQYQAENHHYKTSWKRRQQKEDKVRLVLLLGGAVSVGVIVYMLMQIQKNIANR